jgi:glycosyltransferase involved in cell wall biosynthesis
VSQPLVSVVTPFHNTAPYLAQCIESVLGQSYTRFEYILADNCSTDGSGEIAETYARRDPRIRLVRRSQLLSQVQNYNAALTEISADSQYCKIVQADDCIFPDCLRLMVQAFEQSASIGLVSAYDLKRNTVRGSGFPYPTSILPGPEMARLCLRTGLFVFGSPTTVMYRSSLVRDQRPFYDESLLHEDTEKCMQILEHWDFGFVHQVLSFLRVDDESISAAFRTLQPDALDRYIVVQRYAPRFLAVDEVRALRNRTKRDYYDVLSHEALRFRGRDFWRYHQGGLKTLDELLDWPYLALRICRKLLGMAANPGSSALRVLRWLQSKLSEEPSPNRAAVHEDVHGETISALRAPAGSQSEHDKCVNVGPHS